MRPRFDVEYRPRTGGGWAPLLRGVPAEGPAVARYHARRTLAALAEALITHDGTESVRLAPVDVPGLAQAIATEAAGEPGSPCPACHDTGRVPTPPWHDGHGLRHGPLAPCPQCSGGDR